MKIMDDGSVIVEEGEFRTDLQRLLDRIKVEDVYSDEPIEVKQERWLKNLREKIEKEEYETAG